MKFGILKSLAFFFLIEFVFIFVGGGISILLAELGVLNVIFNNIGFPIAGSIIFLIVYYLFPSVYLKCKYWLGFNKKNFLFFFSAYIITGLTFSSLVLIGQVLGFVIPYSNESLNLGIISSHFILTCLVGSTEEFIYRGVLSSYFLNNTNKLFTVIAISIFFSIGHLNYSGILPYLNAFLMSVISILLLFETNSLFPSIGLHCSWNFFYFLLANFYNFKIKIVPIWGNLFELCQICLYIIILLVLITKVMSISGFKIMIKLKK